MCFGGILDCTGMMASVAAVFLKVAKGRGGLVLSTELMCIITNAVCCDQYLSLVLPGRMFKESFEDMRLRPENLSRCLEDAGTITSNFFSWNTCGATMRNFLGVDSSYIPYAILNWLNPIVSIFYGYAGITMTQLSEEEYQKILERKRSRKAGGSQGAGSLALIEKVLPKVREINKDEGVGRARPAFSLCRKYRLRYFRNPGKSTFKAPAMHDRHVRENLRLVICFCLAKKAARFVKTMPKLSKKTSKAGKLC